jgi:hypothetical protein
LGCETVNAVVVLTQSAGRTKAVGNPQASRASAAADRLGLHPKAPCQRVVPCRRCADAVSSPASRNGALSSSSAPRRVLAAPGELVRASCTQLFRTLSECPPSCGRPSRACSGRVLLACACVLSRGAGTMRRACTAAPPPAESSCSCVENFAVAIPIVTEVTVPSVLQSIQSRGPRCRCRN